MNYITYNGPLWERHELTCPHCGKRSVYNFRLGCVLFYVTCRECGKQFWPTEIENARKKEAEEWARKDKEEEARKKRELREGREDTARSMDVGGCHGKLYGKLHGCEKCGSDSCKAAYAASIGKKHWELD
ncbi:MAG: hypothetical protein PHP03_01865 [Candidatus Pacebacteria bacterium]|nr:hypothetical protein [Candidatus Paceibacterota bacterium]